MIVDTAGNRIGEIPPATGSQRGQSMTAGDMCMIAGTVTGACGASGAGTPASRSLLNQPGGIVIDPAGNLYITDTGNAPALEHASSGTQRGQAMTANDSY
jgi:DNA-binding beta-propeller fold protein YncE